MSYSQNRNAVWYASFNGKPWATFPLAPADAFGVPLNEEVTLSNETVE